MPENQTIEWKESWRDEYLKWICGFANAQGGILYIGKNDNGKVVGVKESKKLLEDIPNKVRDILGIVVDVDLINEDNKEYIRIKVDSHSYPVNYKGEYHYRSGSTKQILKGAVLTEFLTTKTGRNWDDIPLENVAVQELDEDSFDIFRSQALKSGRMDTKDLKLSNTELLDSLGLIEYGKLSRAAILLFHRRPEKWIKGSYIKIGFFESDADLRYQDEIHGSLLQQAEKVIDLLFTKYLKAEISYEDVTRIEKFPYPKDGIREAIYNSIIHKNYASQIPIQISVYEDKLYIANDCIFPAGWTVETLLKKHRSKPYNPNVANGFFRSGFVEIWGRGIEKICETCKEYGIERPEYTLYPEDIIVQFIAKDSKLVDYPIHNQELNTIEEMTEVTEVTEEMTEVTEEMTEVTEEMTEVTEEMTEVTEEMTEVTEEMTEVTDEMTEVTEEMTEVTDEMTEATTESMTKRETKAMAVLLEYLKEHDKIDNAIGRRLTGKSSATVKRYLRRLSEVGIIVGEGTTSDKTYSRVVTFCEETNKI
jgi:ATP-dependent DNA helicase RecG